MSQDHILRLRRTDSEGEYILAKVSQTGSKALGLKLVATDNETVYAATVKEANVKTLQASNYSGSLDEWKTVLRYALLQQQPSSPLPEALQDVETVAAVIDSTVTITLRKNIGGIHQRLGSIRVAQKEEQEIDIFEWAGSAAATADDLREQFNHMQASVGSQQDQVAKLTRQLEDLVKAKKEHEEELLKKFAALLNAKKLKIRDQQRLLAGAKVDPMVAAAVSESRNGDGGARQAGASRKGKRKTNGVAEPEPEAQADDNAATDEEGADEDELMREQETPQRTDDDATESEDDEDGGFEAPSALQVSRRGVGSKGGALEAAREEAKGGGATEVPNAGPPPPSRELHFAKKTAHIEAETRKPGPQSQPARPADDEDEDEETDDDEL